MYKNVIAIYGVPRSGTSWLGQILDSSPDVVYKFQPLFSYAFKNYIKVDSSKEEIESFFSKLSTSTDSFLDQTEKRNSGIYPIFNEKNKCSNTLVYKEGRYLYTIPILLKNIEDIKIIQIVRNPWDVLESWMNAPSEYKSEWNIYDEWQFGQSKNQYLPENYFGYYKWKEAVKLFADMEKLYPDKVKIIMYEELEKDAQESVKKLFDFLGLKYTKQTDDFLIESQQKTIDNIYSVFKKKNEIRKRKYYLPEAIRVEMYNDLKGFKESYRFEYNKYLDRSGNN